MDNSWTKFSSKKFRHFFPTFFYPIRYLQRANFTKIRVTTWDNSLYLNALLLINRMIEYYSWSNLNILVKKILIKKNKLVYLDTLSNTIFVSTTTCMETDELTTHQTYCRIVWYCITKLTFLFAILLK